MLPSGKQLIERLSISQLHVQLRCINDLRQCASIKNAINLRQSIDNSVNRFLHDQLGASISMSTIDNIIDRLRNPLGYANKIWALGEEDNGEYWL